MKHSKTTRPALLLPCALLTGVATLTASSARAQTDIEKPLPNVLLLVDTSGSMEFTTNANVHPICNPGNPSATNEKSRWIDLVEVMTGSFRDYSCFAQDRSSVGFKTEFAINGLTPYDFGYINPYHRPLSGDCLVGPGVLPPSSDPFSYPAKGINTFSFSAPNVVSRPGDLTTFSGCAAFSQAQDGLLDIFKDKVRFGLMTFDTHVSAGTGLVGSNADWANGMSGAWSYYGGLSPVTGRPAGCETMQTQEVGARNAAAPPWEGRMVAFGSPNATGPELEQRNGYIQDVLLATRPYGATPIAGLLDDARRFLWQDDTPDPLSTGTPVDDFGPKDDPQTRAANCRRNIIVLLSDGEPNLDLRPHCEDTAAGGVCPYQRPEDIAYALRHNPLNDPDQYVEVVVIGFALARVSPGGGPEIGCEQLDASACATYPDDRAVQACCTLNKIAAAGGSAMSDGSARKAYFPQTRQELRRTFSAILSDLTNSLTTRTSTVFSTVSTTSIGRVEQYASGFVPVAEEPWRGKLTRTRIECENGTPVERAVDRTAGDDFAANVNSAAPTTRKFFTFIPTDVATKARETLRPNGSDADGLGAKTGDTTTGLSPTALVDAVSAELMEASGSDCATGTTLGCKQAVLGWTVGLTNSEGESRCSNPGAADCSLLGAVYHSTPQLVPGKPDAGIRDESYEAFATMQARAERPSVLYTSTIDGMLHAFKTGPHTPGGTGEVNTLANNELWSFLPPAVLPLLPVQYPNTPATLLDGTPVIADVPKEGTAFTRSGSAPSATATWATVLVQGFGNGQIDGGYFALDVTLPDTPADGTLGAGGPKLLWQLTRDAANNRLFGNGGTPLVTNVYARPQGSLETKQIAVAVLPGGELGSRSGTAVGPGPFLSPLSIDPAFQPGNVSSYTGSVEARTLTIVRLDTGEILRTFRSEAPTNAISASVTTIVDIPAPLSGVPAAFPGSPGTSADRIFVGDAEGRVWRVDVSNKDPAAWTMKVFADAYVGISDPQKRQPIQTAPVLSIDDLGRVTLAVATGDQGIQTVGTDMLNRVISVTEVQDDTHAFRTQYNWIQSLGCAGTCGVDQYIGERVTGPLTLFGGTLYFATSSPGQASTSTCNVGTSRIWGVHYTRNADEAAANPTIDPFNGPAGQLPSASTPLPKALPPEDGIIFGVGIQQQPTCASVSETFSGDPYLGGYGTHHTFTDVTPGSFQLVYQVGGVTAATESKVTTNAVTLQPPKTPVFFNSWSRVYE